jgi:NAD+ dependent glucose-6-phosphate dehydrogenase
MSSPADRRPVILITGSAGLIGGVLREQLADRFELRGLDRRGGEATVEGDVRDVGAVERAAQGASAIVHLAGNASNQATWAEVLAHNVEGTWAVFDAARLAGVERVVFASSNHVVGQYELDRAPGVYDLEDPWVLDPEAEPRPDSAYGLSKLIGEQIGRFYAERHGVRVVCLRIGSVVRGNDPWQASQPDRPGAEDRFARYRATWLSHRDCAELIAAALTADVRWAVVYGVSDNRRRFWDLEGAERILGFRPKDRAPLRPPGP